MVSRFRERNVGTRGTLAVHATYYHVTTRVLYYTLYYVTGSKKCTQTSKIELEVLLRWKGVAASKMGNVANRRLLYQQFAEGDIVEEVSIPAPWTDIDEAELVALRDAPIEMYDTAYGRFEEQKKRDVERAYQKMLAAEKDIFKKKMAEIDEADAGVDEESPPPTPTPV